MRRQPHVILAIVLCLALTQLPAPAFAQPARAESRSATKLSVRAVSPAALATIEAQVARTGGRAIGRSKDGACLLVEAPRGVDASAYSASMRREAGVLAAEPLAFYEALATPTDPDYAAQWGLPAVGAPLAWDRTWGSADVKVAVVDTGVALGHAEFAGRIAAGGWDFIDSDAVPEDAFGHGTAVAGVIAAAHDNGVYGTGAAPGVLLLPVRVLDARGSGDSYTVAQGIRYAADQGADVINLSLGGPSDSEEMSLAIAYARERGCIVVAAAGNAASSPVLYPAREQGVIAVGAIDADLSRATFSCWGSQLDLMAPGVAVYSTTAAGAAGWWSGTSFAAPFVSSAAALVRSLSPSATPTQVEALLDRTATDLGQPGRDDQFGYGLLSMGAAVAESVAQPGAFIPVYRFYNASSGTHFFTPSAEERDTVIVRWPNIFAYEGIAYEVNPANPQPLYRFYNRSASSHFYTASAVERDHVIASYPDIFTYEGETYRVALTGTPDDAVYRFYNVRNGSHFYTASTAERDAVIAGLSHVYLYEGPVFHLGR